MTKTGTPRVRPRRDCRDLVVISSLFVRWRSGFDVRLSAGRRLRSGNGSGRRPVNGLYADDFSRTGAGFGALDCRRADRSHGASVEFLAGVFGGAFEANLVT